MTSRERNLLILFVFSLAAAGLLVGLGSYLQAIARLDSEHADLQKRVLRVTQASTAQASTAPQGALSGASLRRLKELFFAAGTLPDPLTLASRVQAALKKAGLVVQESRVMENSGTAQWVQFHAEGSIDSWFRFLQVLRGQDPQTLFRTISLVRKQGSLYAMLFEVGHVVLP